MNLSKDLIESFTLEERRKFIKKKINFITNGYKEDFDRIIQLGMELGFTQKNIANNPVLIYYLVITYMEKYF